MSTSSQTVYFGYGSNLWLEQMHIRCPHSTYIGIARLPNYRWIINDRGYANVVEEASQSSNKDSSATTDPCVYGLVYTLTPTDESRLDINEGVPIAYTKELLTCDFWFSSNNSNKNNNNDGKKIDTSKPPDKQLDMLVYIDRKRVTAGSPREEYVYRMNRGIEDAVKMGVPGKYVRDMMRKYIPEDVGGEGGKGGEMAQFARGQAKQFKDESGVFQ